MPAKKTPRPSGDEHPVLKFSSDGGVSNSRFVQSCTLRSGLVLAITGPSPGTPLKTTFDTDDAPIQFGFTYSGKNRCAYAGGKLRNQTHEMQTGSNGIFYLPKTHGTIERSQDYPAIVIGIVASPDLLRSYFADCMEQLPRTFRRTLEEGVPNDSPMTWFGDSNPAKNNLLAQILNCPYTGGLRKLFLESRVMELLTMQIHDYIMSESGKCTPQSLLCPADVEQIRRARDFLVHDLENPPSISELAVRVGINEKKLKTGFRQVYDTSVFGYFREHRMQRAHEILQQGDCNVTEAAYAVGYQSLSHFSNSFKERFGILPKDFLNSQRRILVP